MVDWNEDGLKDLIVGENNGQVRYYRNIGTATNPVLTYQGLLQVGGVAIDIGSYSAPFVDDWNEDERKDLLVGSTDGRIWLYMNTGTNANPVFSTTQYVLLATGGQIDFGDRSAPGVVDLDGDGLKDLISGAVDGKVYYSQNLGSNQAPVLTNPVALMMGSTQIYALSTTRPAAIDWDGNGAMDMVVGSYDARLRRYMQTSMTSLAPTMDLTLTSSYMIPAAGGTLTYTFAATNASSSSVTFDAWTDLQLPSDDFYGPLFVRSDITLGPSSSLTRSLNQNIPGRAPSGYYYFYGYVGDHENLQVYSQDYFYFYKSTTEGDNWIGDWSCRGWEEESAPTFTGAQSQLVSFAATPNPFNPVTTLQFDLPEVSQASLCIYNTSGQQVAVLVDGFRAAGRHEVSFNAETLPSGVYFAQLQAGQIHTVQKLLLVK
ncbi:MAG: FG-GAP-like repeat-containing protein [bacterium]